MIDASPRRAAGTGRRIRGVALGLALAAVHLAATLVLVVPGHLSVDEGTYHLMVRALARGDGLAADNGYSELRSEELRFASLVAHDGRLMPLPPPFFALLALPCYAAAGYRGLFWLNACAFLGVAALVAWLTRRLFPGRRLAAGAVAVLTLAGFAWPYSLAAWPHLLAALAVTGAFALAVAGAEPARRGLVLSLLSGTVLGIGVGVRLDAAFALPALVAPALTRWPPSITRALAVAAGALPPLAVLAAVNHLKFGRVTPFSYGGVGGAGTRGTADYLPVAASAALVGLAVLGVACLRHRPGRRGVPGRGTTAAALAAVAIVALAVPAFREVLIRLVAGGAQLVVDLRLRDPGLVEPALERSAGGALVYAGGLKKALLQSCPWLAAALLPLVGAGATGRGERRSALLLALVPLLYLGVYAFFAWHGGLCLNLRYLLPALPFLAILGAAAWDWLVAGMGRAVWFPIGAAVAITALGFVGLRRGAATLAEEEFALLSAPLYLAALVLLLAAAAVAVVRRGGDGRLVRSAAACAVAAGWTWSALVAFGYDLPWERSLRAANLRVFRDVEPHVPAGALLHVGYPDPFFGFIEFPDVVLAVPARDDFADFERLTSHFLAGGRPVLAAFRARQWNYVRRRGLLTGLEVEPLWTDRVWYLARLHRAEAGHTAGPAKDSPAVAPPVSGLRGHSGTDAAEPAVPPGRGPS